MGLGLGFEIQNPEKNYIPDPGSRVKKAPDPGTVFATVCPLNLYFAIACEEGITTPNTHKCHCYKNICKTLLSIQLKIAIAVP
jgi:hypothetical protein